MSMLAAAGWDDWVDLPWNEQLSYLAAPFIAIPFALL